MLRNKSMYDKATRLASSATASKSDSFRFLRLFRCLMWMGLKPTLILDLTLLPPPRPVASAKFFNFSNLFKVRRLPAVAMFSLFALLLALWRLTVTIILMKKRHWKKSNSQCLKITQNVVFEFFNFWHFPPIFVFYWIDVSGNTVSPSFSFSKISPTKIDYFWALFMNFCLLKM